MVVSCATPGATTRSESPTTSATSSAAPIGSGTSSPQSTAASSVDLTDVGVLFFFSGAKAGWSRFDGATGKLTDIGYASVAVQAETPQVVYLGGPQGSASLLRWDGTLDQPYDCGGGGSISFNAAGACTSVGSHTGPGPLPITVFHTTPVAVRLPGEAQPRVILPADWGALGAALSPDSARLAVVRVEPPYPTADDQPFRMSLWIVEADGSTRLLYRPAPGRGLPLQWSSDGKYLTGFDARPGDPAPHLLLLEIAPGRVSDLGNAPALPASLAWSADGRLAFVRGSGSVSWRDKEIVLRERDGSERVVTPEGSVGLAPAWDPARGRLAWIAGPAGDGSGYLEGTGVGDRRVVVSNLSGETTEIRCPGRVAEGVRWSRDGEALLLLCRRPGATSDLFELWLHRFNAAGGPATVFVVTGLGWDDYFDRQNGVAPSLFMSVAWSRAVR